jgi:hypothetical protein
MVGHQVVIPHKHLTICVCTRRISELLPSLGAQIAHERALLQTFPARVPKMVEERISMYLDVHPIWLLITDHPILVIRKKVGEFQEGITSIQKTTK